MKPINKLEQYIKKEVDSISYEGEDQMWKNFQENNHVELSTLTTRKSYLTFALLIVLVSVVTIGLYKSQSSKSLSAISEDKIEKDLNSTFNENKKSDSAVKILRENAKAGIESNSSKDKETYLSNIKKTPNTENSSTARISSPSSSSINNLEKVPNTNPTYKSTRIVGGMKLDDNNNQASHSEGRNNVYTAASDGVTKLTNIKALSKQQDLSALESSASTFQNSTFQNIDKLPLQLLKPFTEKMDSSRFPLAQQKSSRLDRCPPNSITNTFFTRANIQASTNNIIQSSFEFGQQVALGRKTGLKFALGVNLVDGFSVSQDSIQIHNGVLIEKVTTNKDLDYVINSQLGFEYVYAFDNFKFSLGPRFSYAIANKVNEDCVKELNFFNFTETSMDNSILSNYWNGINRFGIEGKLEASYQFKKFEIGLNISKRLNKLIKNNEAVSRKSNKPILFGASLSYNLN